MQVWKKTKKTDNNETEQQKQPTKIERTQKIWWNNKLHIINMKKSIFLSQKKNFFLNQKNNEDSMPESLSTTRKKKQQKTND